MDWWGFFGGVGGSSTLQYDDSASLLHMQAGARNVPHTQVQQSGQLHFHCKKKAVRTPVGILIAIKVFTCFNNLFTPLGAFAYLLMLKVGINCYLQANILLRI